MKIARNIERVITLTAEEVYAAVAAKYDLPSKPDHCRFDSDVCHSSEVTLIVTERTEQGHGQ